MVPAVIRLLADFGLVATGIWAAEHVYNIYNRRFETLQMIAVYAAEVGASEVRLDPQEHSEWRWCSFEEGLSLVNYRWPERRASLDARVRDGTRHACGGIASAVARPGLRPARQGLSTCPTATAPTRG